MRNTNTYRTEGDTTYIATRSGHVISIDTADVALVSGYTWCIEGTGYAMSRSRGPGVKMHRLILNAPKGVCVDHINGDPLDNRRANLRLCRKQQNEFNTKIRTDNSSGYRGVCFAKKRNMFRAYITRDGRQRHLGYFKTPEEAAIAYNGAARIVFGEFARLNKIV